MLQEPLSQDNNKGSEESIREGRAGGERKGEKGRAEEGGAKGMKKKKA